MNNEIEIQAANMLLERCVKVKIGRRNMVIRQPTIGALIAVSREYRTIVRHQ